MYPILGRPAFPSMAFTTRHHSPHASRARLSRALPDARIGAVSPVLRGQHPHFEITPRGVEDPPRDKTGEFAPHIVYYRILGDVVLYGPTLHAVARFVPTRLELDPAGLCDYLRYGYTAHQLTIFKNIHCILKDVRDDQDVAADVERAVFAGPAKAGWPTSLFVEAERRTTDPAPSAGAFYGLLLKAIEQHCSTQSNAVSLSSGIDSFILAHALATTGHACTALTLSFGPDLEYETDMAIGQARALGLPYEVVTLDGDLPIAALRAVLGRSEPAPAWSALAQHAILTRCQDEGFESLIAGFGADEVFCGYRAQLAYLQRVQQWESIPYDGICHFFSDERLSEVASERCLSAERPLHAGILKAYCEQPMRHKEPVAYMIYHEMLHRTPRCIFPSLRPEGGAATRMVLPYLSDDVVRAAYRTPTATLLADQDVLGSKPMLRCIAYALGHAGPDQERHIFTVPFAHWLRHADGFFDLVERSMVASHPLINDLLHVSKREEITKELRAAIFGGGPMRTGLLEEVWIVTSLVGWLRHHAL